MTDEKENKNNDTPQPTGVDDNPGDTDTSAIYRKDPKTGKWIVQNPAGSMGYNYLYRDE